jgi:signal transduction histidine kinase
VAAKKRRAAQASGEPASEVQREIRVARALKEVAGALGASLELDELLELVLERTRELGQADRAALFLLDERRQELVSRLEGAEGGRIAIGLSDGPLGQVARTGRSLRLEGTLANANNEWDEALGGPTEQALLLPLKNNLSRTIGVFLIARTKKSRGACAPFTEEEEEIVGVFARQAAVAIDNSRLLVTLIRKNQQLQQAQEQLTRRVRDLELLFELERGTSRAHSHDELARVVLERLARACGAERAVLSLTLPESTQVTEYSLTRTLHRHAGRSEEQLQFNTALVALDASPLAQVLRSGSPAQLDLVPSGASANGVGRLGSTHLPDAPSLRSLIAEPLEGAPDLVGALGVVNKQQGPFTAEDLGLLRLVAANVGTAVRLFDASRAREREERLSAIGGLLSQVIHDLKSPLTVISGSVQLMVDAKTRAERERYASEVLRQFEALGAMQREILAFARGETKVFVRRVLLDNFFTELVPVLERELAGKDVELQVVCERKLVAHFDSERITRVLQNLVRNAAEALAGRAGGKVTIVAARKDTDLLLRVSDNGPGIPPEIAARLFQSFVTRGKPDGTGLGLAIVRRIVEEHGGTIQLIGSEFGACFSIVLPDAFSERGGESSS